MKKLVLVAAMAGLFGCTSAQAVDNTNEWVNGEVYSSSYFGMKAKVTLSTSNKVSVYFLLEDDNCLNKTSMQMAAPVQVNGQWVKMAEQCNRKGLRSYWAATQEGRKFILNEFKKTKGDVEILSKGYSMLYSANKFTREYNKVVQRKVQEATAI